MNLDVYSNQFDDDLEALAERLDAIAKRSAQRGPLEGVRSRCAVSRLASV